MFLLVNSIEQVIRNGTTKIKNYPFVMPYNKHDPYQDRCKWLIIRRLNLVRGKNTKLIPKKE